MTTQVVVGRVRSVVLLVLFSILTLNLYYLFWLFQLNKETRAFTRKGMPPIVALVVFLVPVLGWFFALWLTARGVMKAQSLAGQTKLVAPIYPSLYAALVPILGWYIAAGYVQGGANRLWAEVSPVLEWVGTERATIECPDCSTRFPVVLNPVVERDIACPSCRRVGAV